MKTHFYFPKNSRFLKAFLRDSLLIAWSLAGMPMKRRKKSSYQFAGIKGIHTDHHTTMPSLLVNFVIILTFLSYNCYYLDNFPEGWEVFRQEPHWKEIWFAYNQVWWSFNFHHSLKNVIFVSRIFKNQDLSLTLTFHK